MGQIAGSALTNVIPAHAVRTVTEDEYTVDVAGGAATTGAAFVKAVSQVEDTHVAVVAVAPVQVAQVVLFTARVTVIFAGATFHTDEA
jgi:hypothetical protein